MNDSSNSQDHPANPSWNSYNWNHMALPTFGFIFAVPEPPANLQLPDRQQPLATTETHAIETAIDQKSNLEDEPSHPDSHHSSLAVSRLQSRRQRKSETDKRLKQRSQPHTKPTVALQRGNSDPFSAAGITITPQINRILTFARDVCLPAFYFVDSLRDSFISAEYNRDVANSSGWISSPAARLGWQQVVDALADKCTALACLSTYLALMAICNIDSTKSTECSLKMRAGSSALLRRRLHRHDAQKTDVYAHRELLWQVFWHFYAEFFAGNLLAAQLHGKMLRQSCENAESGLITDHFLDSVMFVDSHMAAKYMTRPVLDVESWVPNIFTSTWNRIDGHISELTGEVGDGLHGMIESPKLRHIFTRTRQALILLRQSEEAKSFNINFETIYYWLNSHSYVDSGILIDSYLKLTEQAMRAPTTESSSDTSQADADSLGKIYTEASLSLSALFAIRDIGQEIRINSFDVVDASSTITKHLREALEKAVTNCTPGESSRYRAIHLWCAFTGALIEQRQSVVREINLPPPAVESKRKKGNEWVKSKAMTESEVVMAKRIAQFNIVDPSSLHFNHLLAEIAHSMGLLSWQQLSDTLKSFIYTDLSEPHGSRWFWKTMGAYLDNKRKAAREQHELRRVALSEHQKSSGGFQEPLSSQSPSKPLPLRRSPFSQSQDRSNESRRRSSLSVTSNSDVNRPSPSAGARQSSESLEHRRWSIQRTHSHGLHESTQTQHQQLRHVENTNKDESARIC